MYPSVSICNHMGLRAVKDEFHANFKVFTKLPSLLPESGNLENIENTSEINP